MQAFEEIQPLVVSVLDGYNVCIFAYGQVRAARSHAEDSAVAVAVTQFSHVIHAHYPADWLGQNAHHAR